MRKIVGVVNYKTAGNICSVQKALQEAGAEVVVISDPNQIRNVPRLVIPGVGGFKESMKEMHDVEFVEAIKSYESPILGICLGMQILGRIGFEHGFTSGLGLIDAEVKPIQCLGKVPHMGFETVKLVKESKLFRGIEQESFYFMHSYEVVNYTDVLSLTEYGEHTFVSSIQKNNVYGVQFHPEKSRGAGIKLFENFLTV